MKVITESITQGVIAPPPKRNLILGFEKRGAARKEGTDTTKCFTRKSR
jgi:hypothetical protein